MTPIRKTIDVPLSPQDAFDLFLKEMDIWWPKESHSQFGKDSTLVVEPCKGGIIKEIARDGREALWGRIIGWDPNAYLAFTWCPGVPEEDATVVAVSFHATADGTRLELTHGGFDILGETADAVSTSYLLSWDLVLGTYCFAARRELVLA